MSTVRFGKVLPKSSSKASNELLDTILSSRIPWKTLKVHCQTLPNMGQYGMLSIGAFCNIQTATCPSQKNIYESTQERGPVRPKKMGANKNHPKRCRQISHMAIFPNVACTAMCKRTTLIPANLDDVILNIHVTNVYIYI